MLEWYEAYADYNDMRSAGVAASPSSPSRSGTRARSTSRRRGGARRSATRSRARPASTCSPTATGTPWRQDRERGIDVPTRRDLGPARRPPALQVRRARADQPTFLLDYPVELSPFAKDHRSEAGARRALRVLRRRMEFANAFTELNDPDDQRARFEQQVRRAAAGDEETQPYDEGYLRALEHGMPPTGGIGIGIDRLVMLLTGRARSARSCCFRRCGTETGRAGRQSRCKRAPRGPSSPRLPSGKPRCEPDLGLD